MTSAPTPDAGSDPITPRRDAPTPDAGSDPITPRRDAPATDEAALPPIARLEAAERRHLVALWSAARAAGAQVTIVDHGSMVAAATPAAPGPLFNGCLGLDGAPVELAAVLELWERAGVTGYVQATAAPWPCAIAEAQLAVCAGRIADVPAVPAIPGLHIRLVEPAAADGWAAIVVAGSLIEPTQAALWHAAITGIEPGTEQVLLFVAEVDGVPAGAARVACQGTMALLGAASVLTAYRGRGIQRALLDARARAASERGCRWLGSTAEPGGISERNMAAMGIPRLGLRMRYRVAR